MSAVRSPSVRLGAPLRLSVACDPFDSVRPLLEGRAQVPGVELAFQTHMTSPERHRRMVRDLAYDICEINVSTFLIARAHGVPVVGVPVFLFRKFRHGNVFVRGDAGIESPRDLVGRRVGVPNRQPAANVWIKGILRDEFGLDHRDMIQVADADEEIGFEDRSGAKVERAPAGRRIFDMLLDGELDAAISPLVPDAIVTGDTRVRRLFPDYPARERAYYRRTRLFPIMHVTAVRATLLREHPWLAGSLVQAFECSKQLAYAHTANTRLLPLAWFGAYWEDEQALFAGDAWPHGLGEVNRRNLQTVIEYSFDQGLIPTKPRIDDLFADAGGAITKN